MNTGYPHINYGGCYFSLYSFLCFSDIQNYFYNKKKGGYMSPFHSKIWLQAQA